MGIREKLGELGQKIEDHEESVHERAATAVCHRTRAFFFPGEQIQVAFPAWRHDVAGHMEEVALNLLAGSRGYASEGETVAIAVTDRAIIAVGPSDVPSTGPYRRYPRNVHLQLEKVHYSPMNSPDVWGRKLLRLGNDRYFPDADDWGYWEPWPPGPGATTGSMEKAIAQANTALDIMIANKDFDPAPAAHKREVPPTRWLHRES
jgi:hypothetical protein